MLKVTIEIMKIYWSNIKAFFKKSNKKESRKITTEDIFSKHFIEDLDKITVNIERATKSLNNVKYEYTMVNSTLQTFDYWVNKKASEGFEICGTITPYSHENNQGVLIPMRKQL